MFVGALVSPTPSKTPVPPHLRPHHNILHQMTHGPFRQNPNGIAPSSFSKNNNCIWIDMENVRGKSGFELTHQQVLHKTAAWAEHFQLVDQVVVVVDHGEESAFYLPKQKLGVTFSGNGQKADDVIANGVASFEQWWWMESGKHVNINSSLIANGKPHVKLGKTIVVTADNELQGRCRRACKAELLHVMDPQTFLDDLEWVAEQDNAEHPHSLPQHSLPPLSLNEQIKMGSLDTEIKLRGQLLDAEMQLDTKRRSKVMTKKRRKKMEARVQALRRKLALRGPSLLDQLTANAGMDTNAGGENDLSHISREEQDILLARWRELQKRVPRKEQTGDRIVYAERLRRELEEDDDALMLVYEGFESDQALPSAQAFVRYTNQRVLREREVRTSLHMRNGQQHHAPHSDHGMDVEIVKPPEFSTEQRLQFENKDALETLDLVVISDTHGFEGQFDNIQSGDVLLHLGDFAYEGSHEAEQRGLAAFDRWLAKQDHDYKIVIRGNHDPFHFDFPLSKAMYVASPTSINIGGFEMALIPHGSPRKLAASGGIPPTCDLIASHVPPFKTLDKTYSGTSAGSSFLCNVVRGMPLGPPPVWLVGHIHEGRGVARRQFGRHNDRETLVINAANANSGRATHLTHGPVVLRLEKEGSNVHILSMDDMSINQAPSYKEFFETSENKSIDDNGNHLLMAVDLGLKSGVSLFNSNGQLIRYEQFLFDRGTLEETIPRMIQEWESEAGEDWSVTHLAIEGGDTALLNMWERATPNLSTLRVRPEEWRAEMLTKKESQDGASAKAASRLIARQVVEDFGIMDQHEGKFHTDVAEAVLLGMHVARRLGWIEREPAVRRYSNGNVVIPKKAAVKK